MTGFQRYLVLAMTAIGADLSAQEPFTKLDSGKRGTQVSNNDAADGKGQNSLAQSGRRAKEAFTFAKAERIAGGTGLIG